LPQVSNPPIARYGATGAKTADIDPLIIQQLFAQAAAHHQAGLTDEAERLYRQILSRQPDLADTLQRLGLIALDKGQNAAAVDLFRKVVSLNPNSAEAHNNLGIALTLNGQHEEAVAAYRSSIALNPNLAQVHGNLASALMETGRIDEAITAYRRAIVLTSDDAEAHNNLGIALGRQKRTDEAIAAYRQAVSLDPAYAEAQSNLGCALRDKGQLDEAIAAFQQAIAACAPATPPDPNLPDLYNNLGLALTDKGRLDEAAAAFGHAIALRPDYAEVHNNLGNALKDLGRLDDAIAAYRKALDLNPDLPGARSNLIFAMHYHPGFGPGAIREELQHWNEKHAEPLRKFIPVHRNDRNPDRRLRIGYVSADFRDHIVGRSLLPLIRHHDRRSFEITCYSNVRRSDEMTRQFQQSADRWRDILAVSDEQTAEQICEDEIDILIDLALHTGRNRLLVFARKPAPIQATYLGYPGSTGLSAIDYRLSDPFIDPLGTDGDYTEKTIRLSHTYLCWQWNGKDAPVGPPPARMNGYVTFGCMNNFCKITPAVLETWGKLMSVLPNSRLILRCPSGSPLQRVLATLGEYGIDPTRIDLIGRLPADQYVDLYHSIDIALDPFPYTGHTTSLDALWMGVPLVTLSGQTAVGRGGRSILSNLGLPEFIAHSPDQYIQIALGLANDLGQLAALRKGLRARLASSPLVNAEQLARDLEAAFRHMWRDWCDR
jgi:protein O-GlcNAc transferase